MEAAYLFRVTFQLDPDSDRARIDPERFETTLEVPAPPPGEPGWLLFRNRLWRGQVGDEPSMCEFASDRLGVDVVAIEFAELRTDEAYLDALKEAVADDPGAFNAESVDEVLHKYLGSSIHVRD